MLAVMVASPNTFAGNWAVNKPSSSVVTVMDVDVPSEYVTLMSMSKPITASSSSVVNTVPSTVMSSPSMYSSSTLSMIITSCLFTIISISSYAFCSLYLSLPSKINSTLARPLRPVVSNEYSIQPSSSVMV